MVLVGRDTKISRGGIWKSDIERFGRRKDGETGLETGWNRKSSPITLFLPHTPVTQGTSRKKGDLM